MHMLFELLNNHCRQAAESGDWNECADILNDRTVNVPDQTPITYSVIRERLGEDARLTIANTVRAAAQQDGDMNDAHLLLLGGGLRLDLPERQQALGVLAAVGQWSAELLAAARGLGMQKKSIADLSGLPVVSAAACQSAWTQGTLSAALVAKRQNWDAAVNVALTGIANGSISTEEQLNAVLSVI